MNILNIFLLIGNSAILLIVIVAVLAFFVVNLVIKHNQKSVDSENVKHSNAEIIKVLLSLEENSLNRLFEFYKENYGKGAAYYAKRTYKKWKDGKVRPNQETLSRFLVNLPKVISYDLKCEILRHLMLEYCEKSHYEIDVSPDNWKETLTPLVEEIIEKTYKAELPDEITEKLHWLADGEMKTAQEILRHSKAEESKFSFSLLDAEIESIKKILEEKHLSPKIKHQLNFPCGKITLRFKEK